MLKNIIRLTIFAALVTFTGCQTTQTNIDKPKVEVVGIEKLETLTDFLLQLKITNPNSESFNLNGLFYELSIENIKVIHGITKEIPTIEGFSSQTVSIKSSANLINAAKLTALIVNKRSTDLNYTLKAKMDSNSKSLRTIKVEESGKLSL